MEAGKQQTSKSSFERKNEKNKENWCEDWSNGNENWAKKEKLIQEKKQTEIENRKFATNTE